MKKVRSPSYPALSLPEALDRARTLYEKEHRAEVRPEMAVSYWGFVPSSSGGRRIRTALEAFGLLEGEDRIRITDRAVRLLLDESGPERERLLGETALLPPLYARLWERYGPNPPAPRELRLKLILDDGFNENSVDGFIRSYLETLEFAGLRGDRLEPAPPSPPPLPPLKSLPPPPPRPAAEVDPAVFPLLDGNAVEFKIRRKISSEEAEDLRAMFEIWLRKIVER
ncbi:MAG TPA: hypothetical protein VLQ45_23775 [Thermoanaerobaculia bacterium]|nr:hypothetical protein [Thermoanaerobaculia bacterium]